MSDTPKETLTFVVPPDVLAADARLHSDTPIRYEVEVRPNWPGGCCLNGYFVDTFGERRVVNVNSTRRLVMMLLSRIAELSLKAARWDECERLAERFTGATGATFWELQPQQGESFAAAIDDSREKHAASIAERAAIEARGEKTNQ